MNEKDDSTQRLKRLRKEKKKLELMYFCRAVCGCVLRYDATPQWLEAVQALCM
jgi:hypothetical protein